MKAYTIRHRCGHNDTELLDDTRGPFALADAKNAAAALPCRRCRAAAAAPVAAPVAITEPAPLAIDLTMPAGAALTTVKALRDGWTEAEIVAGARFNGEPTFVCAGCGHTHPRRLAMMANLGMSCPDCYDDLAG